MAETEHPAPDQIPGAPHPRETLRLFGQSQAEAALVDAVNGDRMHHGWLFCGPNGVGKSTLAWRFARYLIATPPAGDDGLFGAPPPATSLDIDPEHPVARRMLAGSDPGLRSVTRTVNPKTDRMRTEIVVDDIRALGQFFHMSATEGGRRVVIIDAADEMNTAAANALLKMLEEPPENAVLILIAHQPSRLLPTIRSRCRTLRLAALGPGDMAAALEGAGLTAAGDSTALAELAAGSVGAAVRLSHQDGLSLYRDLVRLLGTMPDLDRPRAIALAESVAARGAEDKRKLLFWLLDIALARLVRTGVTGSPLPDAAAGEAEAFLRLAPHPGMARAWATSAETAMARARHGLAVNLDAAALVLDTLFALQKTIKP